MATAKELRMGEMIGRERKAAHLAATLLMQSEFGRTERKDMLKLAVLDPDAREALRKVCNYGHVSSETWARVAEIIAEVPFSGGANAPSLETPEPIVLTDRYRRALQLIIDNPEEAERISFIALTVGDPSEPPALTEQAIAEIAEEHAWHDVKSMNPGCPICNPPSTAPVDDQAHFDATVPPATEMGTEHDILDDMRATENQAVEEFRRELEKSERDLP